MSYDIHVLTEEHAKTLGKDINSVADNNRPQTNQNEIAKRDCAICFNNFCPDITEYPLGQELCTTCNRPLSKSIKGSKLFELIGEST